MTLHIFLTFLKLGVTSFGGPMAHLAIFRQVFVQQRQWLNEAEYSQLVALCQVIPGPASSQVGMALGYRQGRLTGAIAAFVGFTLPSALIMGLAGWGWVQGVGLEIQTLVMALKCVAVAIVTDAVLGMWRSLCQTPACRLWAVVSVILLLGVNHPLMPLIILTVALVAGVVQHQSTPPATNHLGGKEIRHLIRWLAVMGALGGLLWLAVTLKGGAAESLAWSMYQSGALVFGGGHVVLPLLDATVSPPIAPETFLAGYGFAQAMPGPLFTLASFIGAVYPGIDPVVGVGLATICIFIPGILYLVATLPAAVAMMGALQPRLQWVNACVVGLLLAVLIDPIIQTTVVDGITTLLAGVGLVMTLGFRQSPLRVVIVLVTLAYAVTAVSRWVL